MCRRVLTIIGGKGKYLYENTETFNDESNNQTCSKIWSYTPTVNIHFKFFLLYWRVQWNKTLTFFKMNLFCSHEQAKVFLHCTSKYIQLVEITFIWLRLFYDFDFLLFILEMIKSSRNVSFFKGLIYVSNSNGEFISICIDYTNSKDETTTGIFGTPHIQNVIFVTHFD